MTRRGLLATIAAACGPISERTARRPSSNLLEIAKQMGWKVEFRNGHRIFSGVVPIPVPPGFSLRQPDGRPSSCTLDALWEMSHPYQDRDGL